MARRDTNLPATAPHDYAPQVPQPSDPKVVAAAATFMNGYNELQRSYAAACADLDERDRTIAKLQDRNDLLHNELKVTQRARDEYQRGYYELRAQLSALASSAISASDQVAATARSALAATHEAMRVNGAESAAELAPAMEAVMEEVEEAMHRRPEQQP